MSLGPDIIETLARARADLRMGVPIVLTGAQSVIAVAVETLSDERLAGIRDLGSEPVLSLTGWRAQNLKARAYDGDLSLIHI